MNITTKGFRIKFFSKKGEPKNMDLNTANKDPENLRRFIHAYDILKAYELIEKHLTREA